MTKIEFLAQMEAADAIGDGVTVKVEVPGNKQLEEIYNHPEDVKNKTAYYDKTYDDNMKHKHGPVRIVEVSVLR